MIAPNERPHLCNQAIASHAPVDVQAALRYACQLAMLLNRKSPFESDALLRECRTFWEVSNRSLNIKDIWGVSYWGVSSRIYKN